MAVYGYCPICGSEVITRERRPNGNDTCKEGHVFPSIDTVHRRPKVNAVDQKNLAVILAAAWYMLVTAQTYANLEDDQELTIKHDDLLRSGMKIGETLAEFLTKNLQE